MKILSVLGSPDKKGSTSVLVDEYLRGVGSKYNNLETTKVYTHHEEIKPCRGCHACKMSDEIICVIKDDMHNYFDKLKEADVILLATPIYWFGMTAQIKAFIDRIYAIDYIKELKGKKLVLLTTFAAEDKSISGTNNVINEIKSICDYIGIDFAQEYGASSSEPINENEKVLKEIYELGATL